MALGFGWNWQKKPKNDSNAKENCSVLLNNTPTVISFSDTFIWICRCMANSHWLCYKKSGDFPHDVYDLCSFSRMQQNCSFVCWCEFHAVHYEYFGWSRASSKRMWWILKNFVRIFYDPIVWIKTNFWLRKSPSNESTLAHFYNFDLWLKIDCFGFTSFVENENLILSISAHQTQSKLD